MGLPHAYKGLGSISRVLIIGSNITDKSLHVFVLNLRYVASKVRLELVKVEAFH